MITLGINGGFDLPYENEFNFHAHDWHDAAAALVVDGKLVSAIEEERLNRIKHSNKTPLNFATKFVLEDYGISINDVDRVSFYSTEKNYNDFLKIIAGNDYTPIRKRITEKINQVFNCDFDQEKVVFVHHHAAHAASTIAMSGFDDSLILTMDGIGDGIAGLVLMATGGEIQKLHTIPFKNSLGNFYSSSIEYLGFGIFDEYKVMGLAPYGNPDAYKDVFSSFYDLLPNGKFETHNDRFFVLRTLPGMPREKNEPFTQVHKDIAAGIQHALEQMIMHLLEYYKETYNPSKLCLAGGVAQNCSVNGEILYSGMFDDVFVQPASTDAGCAIGAALFADITKEPTKNSRLEHVYWGTDIGNNDRILETLKCWEPFIHYEKVDNITETTAKLMADGAVVGWVQGRTEFGPRALGNRSILADPRPEKNKDIINAMVKKREAFRPFAPSVLEEYVEEYYEIPSHLKYKKFPFMTFVLDVKEEKQKILGAVTHVDGTSRIQTVSKETNKKYWEVIDEFRKITGIPILLNTSFNNNVEPIVNTVEDALVCYLTTQLNYLVAGDYLIRKKEGNYREYLEMVPSLPHHIILNVTTKAISNDEFEDIYEIRDHFLKSQHLVFGFMDLSLGVVKSTLSKDLYLLLKGRGGGKTLDMLMNEQSYDEEKKKLVVEEINNLWKLRLIKLKPKSTQ